MQMANVGIGTNGRLLKAERQNTESVEIQMAESQNIEFAKKKNSKSPNPKYSNSKSPNPKTNKKKLTSKYYFYLLVHFQHKSQPFYVFHDIFVYPNFSILSTIYQFYSTNVFVFFFPNQLNQVD